MKPKYIALTPIPICAYARSYADTDINVYMSKSNAISLNKNSTKIGTTNIKPNEMTFREVYIKRKDTQ